MKHSEIRSEILYKVKYNHNFFGFFNLHFNKELSKTQEKTIKEKLDHRLSAFALKFLNIYNEKIKKPYKESIRNAVHFSKNTKLKLVSGLDHLFSVYPSIQTKKFRSKS